MTIPTLNWTPQPQLLEQLTDLAQKKGVSVDTLLTEAVVIYLDAQRTQALKSSKPAESDPLIGLFAGSPELATQSEAILQQEITRSGWTWK